MSLYIIPNPNIVYYDNVLLRDEWSNERCMLASVCCSVVDDVSLPLIFTGSPSYC